MRDRILALVPHVTIHTPADAPRVAELRLRLAGMDGVVAAEPFVSFQAMAVARGSVAAITAIGIEPDALPVSTGLDLRGLANPNSVILSDSVAERLGVEPGDTVTLIIPPATLDGSQAVRSGRLRLASIVDSGTELDETLVLLGLDTASALAGLEGGVSGLRLRYEDPFTVDARVPALRRDLIPGAYVTTWRMTHGNLYAAIQLSRDLVVLLLASIIGVAAFNVVSALVLIVIDQQGSIAILRTLGATPAEMAGVFLAQGLIIGVLGSLLGCALGALLSLLLPSLVAGLENLLQMRFLSTDVYPVSFIPVDLRLSDTLLIATVATLMCVLASLYPALRAARLQPASVLHQDS
jgi:lipoprotein-releasing system permease protein